MGRTLEFALNYKRLWLTVSAIIFFWPVNPSLAGDVEEITEDNWTEMVAFSPDLAGTKIKKGKKVTKDNLAEFKKLVPVAMQMLIEKYGLVLKLREYEPVHPSEGYIRATNENRGQSKILDVGDAYNKRGIEGYVAGLPFPNPKSGLEVAWNFYYAYGGDDGESRRQRHPIRLARALDALDHGLAVVGQFLVLDDDGHGVDARGHVLE